METICIYGDNRFSAHTKVREACRGIVVLDGRILLTYETNTDQWFLPGGGLEGGESPEACCIRELAEETGFLVKPLEHFATVHEYYEEWLFISHYFTCEIQGTTQRLLTQREVEAGLEPRWLPLEEAVSIFSRHQDYARDEMKRGAYLREYKALNAYLAARDSNRKYYEAYDDRYRTAHARGVSWMSSVSTPIVSEVLRKYRITPSHRLLEIGCGEGRDSRAVLDRGYPLLATDISPEAISYCKTHFPQYGNRFRVLDCLTEKLDSKFDFIFAVAVVHMLVRDRDRNGFYRFIRNHLAEHGIGLICTMGNGIEEFQSDIADAFRLFQRNHESGKMLVAGTSCRKVSFATLENELARNGLTVLEKGITGSPPDFDSLMYAVVRKANE